MPRLNPGDPFPRCRSPTPMTTCSPSRTRSPATTPSSCLPGAWCPYCNAQLRAFERAGKTMTDAGTRVAALPVDDKETTAALVAKHRLTFPVGYGADAKAVASLTGAFVNPDPTYL
jgi:peroxiredoxin